MMFSSSKPKQNILWGHPFIIQQNHVLGATVKVKDEVTVQWGFKDDYGTSQVVQVKAYYIPTSTVRFFSPQSYVIQEKGDGYKLTEDGSVFTFVSPSPTVRNILDIPIVK